MLPDQIVVPFNLNTTPTVVLAQSVSKPQTHAVVLAQQFDQDILGDLGTVFKNFIDSGQVWALIIGIVIGYVFRGMTTYK
jgi:uncharacterized membrane protein